LEDYYSETPVFRESILTWYEVPSRPSRIIFEVEQTILERDDNIFMSFHGFTEDSETFFRISET